MLVLGLDTTSAHGSLALWEDGRAIEETALDGADGYGHFLFQALEALLGRHGRTLRDVDIFAAAAGPGAFTGVRVGLTAVKGLAETCGRRAAGVSNLQALATYGVGPLRAPWMDARRGEIYGAVYDDALELVRPEVVMTAADWRATLPADVEWVEQTLERPLAAAVARIAARTGGTDPAAVDANYVRRSDAELSLKPAV